MKLTYRPEIDGLRAIAVVAVILYHAQITIFGHQPFKGGFIGVDIFFVISGYLITSIILKELVTIGSFSFKHFYERRVRRILPALLFVMLVSLPFAWMYLLPSSFVDFSKSILYSLGFSSNFYFHYSGQIYGAESGLLKPFLHTWSLSVEEQFYILFPIILLVTFKYFKKYLIYILLLGFIISLGLADWGSRNYPSSNFYVLPTRGWELLAGSILAYFEITLGHRRKNKTLNLILPSVGLFLIGHSIISFNDKMFHPSFYTLSPIVGVCLIIWFSNKDELTTKILSTKLFVGLGLISYSLYLWHYPIFAFARIKYNNPLEHIKFEWILLSIILSLLSYFFIEKPFRNNKYNFKIIFFIIFIFSIFSIFFNLIVIKNEGFKKRFSQIYYSAVGKRDLYYVLQNQDGDFCHGSKYGCQFNKEAKKKIYIIGDSIIAGLNLKNNLVQKSYEFNIFTKGNCLYYIDFDKFNFKTQKKLPCNNEYFNEIKKKLLNEKNSIILFGGNITSQLDNSDLVLKNRKIIPIKQIISDFVPKGKYKTLQDSFRYEVSQLSKNNKVIFLYPIPEVGFYPIGEFYKNNKLQKKIKLEHFVTTSYEFFKIRNKITFDLFDSIDNKNIIRLYPHKLFCNTIIPDKCLTHDFESFFYVDPQHLSVRGAGMVNDLIMKEIEKIELKSN